MSKYYNIHQTIKICKNKGDGVVRIKLHYSGLFLIICLFVIAGCSGSVFKADSAGSSGANSTGSLKVSIQWPSKLIDKYISAGTERISITITGDGISGSMATIVSYGQNTITIKDIPVGQKSAEILCLDSNSNILSSTMISFLIIGGQTASSSIILGATLTNIGFKPQTISIPIGTTLYWVNKSGSTASLNGNSPFDNSSFENGESKFYTFNTAGTFNYENGNNPSFTGTVVVTKTPVITNINPSSGPAGTSVTITGTGFGDSQRSSTVSFAGTSATTISSWSDTQIVCTVPSGAASGNVVVTVNFAASGGYPYSLIAYPGIYIASPNIITRIDNMNGDNITSIGSPGSGDYQFSYPIEVFIDDNTGYVYVADKDNHRICRFFNMQQSGWAAYGSLGAGAGQFNRPWSIFVDNTGFIYIADTDNSRLVRINDMTGAGWTVKPIIEPQVAGIKISGYIYLATSAAGGEIVRLNDMSDNGRITYTAGGGINDPRGVDIDSLGRIYIADSGNNRIIRIDDMTGTNFTTYGSLGAGTGQFNFPTRVRIDSNNKIYIVDRNNNRIVRIDDMNGGGWTIFTGIPATPEGLDVNL